MFPEPREAHPDDRSSLDSRDTSASSARSGRSAEHSPLSPVAGDDATMPIVIDDADSNVSAGTRLPTKHDTADGEAADLTIPPAGDVPDVSAQSTASLQHIDRHRQTWPMVSLMANVVMVTAAVTAGIMHAMSSPNGGFIQVVSLAASMCSTACALSIAFAVM
eukprot:46675-Pleurochrysis_carterae.AAC.1